MIYENLSYFLHKAVVEFSKMKLQDVKSYIKVGENYYKIEISELKKGAVNRLKLGGFIQDEN